LRNIVIFLVLILTLLSAVSNISLAQDDGRVDLFLEPATITGNEGDIIKIDINGVTNGQSFKAVDVFLDFDPAFLQVVDSNGNPSTRIQPSDLLSDRLKNVVINETGEIGYSAGSLDEISTTETFTIATIYFKIEKTIDTKTEITFHTEYPRTTTVAFSGFNAWGSLTGSSVSTIATAPEPVAPIVSDLPPPPFSTDAERIAATQPSPSEPPSPPSPTEPDPAPPSVPPVPAPTPVPTPPATNPEQPSPKPSQPPTTVNPAPPVQVLPQPITVPPDTTPEPGTGIPWWTWLIIGAIVVIAGLRYYIFRIRKNT